MSDSLFMNIELPLDRTARKQVRPVSKALFHSEYTVEAMLLMLKQDRFYGAQVAELTGCQPNFASSLLGRLEAAGLVEKLPTESGQLRRYYRRRPSGVWDALQTIIEELLKEPPTDVARLTPRS
jgi:DNA-binding MarR family transcriptional regulator